jgi:hypothetical protein
MSYWSVVLFGALALAGCRATGNQNSVPSETPVAASGIVVNPSGTCSPAISQASGDARFCVTVAAPVGVLGETPVFWHLYTYPTAAEAEAARGPRGAVTQSLERYWLFAIEAEGWRPTSGERVAVIGPLPSIRADVPYTARYFEAVFPPGFITPPGAHRHSGPEAWYVLTGAQCLETPAGPLVTRAGESSIVPAGPPMAPFVVGDETRRSVSLILHPTAELPGSAAPDWTPRGTCPQ